MKIAAATTPLPPFAPYSHSILSNHLNWLIFNRKIFLMTVEAQPSSRQNLSLMISKKIRALRIQRRFSVYRQRSVDFSVPFDFNGDEAAEQKVPSSSSTIRP